MISDTWQTFIETKNGDIVQTGTYFNEEDAKEETRYNSCCGNVIDSWYSFYKGHGC